MLPRSSEVVVAVGVVVFLVEIAGIVVAVVVAVVALGVVVGSGVVAPSRRPSCARSTSMRRC